MGTGKPPGRAASADREENIGSTTAPGGTVDSGTVDGEQWYGGTEDGGWWMVDGGRWTVDGGTVDGGTVDGGRWNGGRWNVGMNGDFRQRMRAAAAETEPAIPPLPQLPLSPLPPPKHFPAPRPRTPPPIRSRLAESRTLHRC